MLTAIKKKTASNHFKAINRGKKIKGKTNVPST